LDGFYAISTNLEEKDIELVLKQNKRWLEIAESFESIQSELKSVPSNISRQEVMDVHLLICFISLLVSRILELYLNDGYTRTEIHKTLKEQNITHVRGNDYVPSFVRTDLTDDLAKIFGFEFATELISEKSKEIFKTGKIQMNHANKMIKGIPVKTFEWMCANAVIIMTSTNHNLKENGI
jgi:hypothetical protein